MLNKLTETVVGKWHRLQANGFTVLVPGQVYQQQNAQEGN